MSRTANPLTALLLTAIRERGPITVAEFMEVALYHPEHGYYASARRRSGHGGDFYTSVDVGPLFGQLLARQIAEMWSVLRAGGATAFHLVEAGAGDGRLARDILDAIAASSPELYSALRVTLGERSGPARGRHLEVLGPHAARVSIDSTSALPGSITGVIIANELLDALPVHVVVMTSDGPGEVHVGEDGGAFREVVLPLADQTVRELVSGPGTSAVDVGIRVEAGVAAVQWMANAAHALERGFVLIMDYGREADELRAFAPAGTLVACARHAIDADRWFDAPGSRDLTAHVNLTAIRAAARQSGLSPLGLVDQTYFLLSLGLLELLGSGQDVPSIRRRLAARTLIQPGALGSAMKAMVFGKGVGTPALRGFAGGRTT